MRILEIGARDFLSFDQLNLKLDPRITVIVGPNGLGKTNMARILQMCREVPLWGGYLGPWKEAGRLGRGQSLYSSTEISLKVELDRIEERKTLAVFLRYALAQGVVDKMGTNAEILYAQYFDNVKRPKAFHIELQLGWLGGASSSGIRCKLRVEDQEASWDSREGLRAEGGALEALCHIAGIGAFKPIRMGKDPIPPRPMEPRGLAPLLLIPLVVMTSRLTLSEQREVASWLDPLGIKWEASYSYELSHILGGLLRWKIRITDNIRAWPAEEWALDEKSLWGSPSAFDISDGRMLPAYLFRLSHGGREEQERFQKVLERFKELTGQKAAVRVRPEMLPDKQRLRIEIVLEDPLGDISIRFAGAGMWEALVLSALLAEEDKVLVLDEPALNLHPPLQRKILKALREREGQVILITHSPYMILLDEPQDLKRIIRFCKDEKEGATRIQAISEEADEKDLRDMLRQFRRSADVAAFLLAGGVILTEGETESEALQIWWQKSTRIRQLGGLEERALAIRSVGGDQGFEPHIRLLKAWGIPWAAVVDGESVRAVLKKNRKLLGLELRETEIDQKQESEIREIAEQHGIFTLNQSLAEGQNFESLTFVASHLAQAKDAVGKESKVLQGAWIAETMDPPSEVEKLYERILRRLFPGA